MTFHRDPSTFVNQVHILAKDVERSLLFYQEIIGFRILEHIGKKVVLTADGKTPLVTIEQPENVLTKEPRTTGLYHFALLLPQRSDLAKALSHLINTGYPLQGASDHRVSEAIYLADPDGNGIEIYADRPLHSWIKEDGQILMTTERLDIENLLQETKGEPWNGLPEHTIMGHIHLHVSDLQKAEDFYCKGLGFNVVNRYGEQATFISTGGYHHHIGMNTWNGVGAKAPAANSVGMKWFSLVFPNEKARNEAVNKLKTLGVSVQEEEGILITKDPSGNHIRLCV
ncbi:VOC family protein [Bacillus chungangensis]|uniref:Catechol 2,3-dioxygenase n=1 Tax=Bacillus chungangensis TaxID=587633 RepID=A0ABT9WXL0_9BACI|nr:VOC family protein [Bacillus chungangensis]MDQ0178033.1 catechol 2,3-dioxygenase [Bacillus chungangensis]